MSKLKKLSATFLIQQSWQAFKRFPATLICALSGSLLLSYWLKYDDLDYNLDLINILLTLALGIPFFFGVQVFTETRQLSRKQSIGMHLIGLILLLLVWWSLPGDDITTNLATPYYRYSVLNVAIHLLVSFIPFTKKMEINGFWNFNKELFIRFFTSTIYSLILYGGLSLALIAIKELFDVNIKDEIFAHLLFFALFMNTLFFTSGISKNIDGFEKVRNYPKPLRFVVQFLFIPILVIYLVILYAYGAKAAFTGEWPEGILSWLVCVIAVFGILTLLLGYPYSNAKEHLWMKKFERFYYLSLFPLIALLFYACAMRISSYGLTINRCVLVVIGIWLFGIAAYFALGKRNIKVVPISLALTLIVVSFGPWSVFNMSERSQVNRMKTILSDGNLLTPEGTVKNELMWAKYDTTRDAHIVDPINNEHLTSDQRRDIYGITQYLMVHHGYDKLNSLFKQDLREFIDSASVKKEYVAERRLILEMLGINAQETNSTVTKRFYPSVVYFRDNSNSMVNLDGLDYMTQFNRMSSTYDHSQCWGLSNEEVCLRNGLHFNSLQCTYKGDTVYFDTSWMVQQLSDEYGNERSTQTVPEPLILKGTVGNTNESFRAVLFFSNFELRYNNDIAELGSIQGFLGVELNE